MTIAVRLRMVSVWAAGEDCSTGEAGYEWVGSADTGFSKASGSR